MELILILLCTSVGTLVGTSVGVLLMHRKTRPLITDAELATLKNNLQIAESSLTATAAALESLRQQVAETEQKNKQQEEDWKARQQQLEVALAEAEKETSKRNEVEQRVQDLSLHTASLTAQRDDLEARVREERSLAAEKAN